MPGLTKIYGICFMYSSFYCNISDIRIRKKVLLFVKFKFDIESYGTTFHHNSINFDKYQLHRRMKLINFQFPEEIIIVR